MIRVDRRCALFQGIDLVEVGTVERAADRSGAHFLRRVYTPAELGSVRGSRRFRRLAAMLAAKEAVLKAFGLGIGHGVRLTHIEVVVDPAGRADVTLRGAAEFLANQLGGVRVLVSLSETREYGVAYVIVLFRRHGGRSFP